MDRILFELRLAWRRLASRPGFATTAVLSLGLGIGACTVFFSLLNSTLLKPLPVERPQELFALDDPRFGGPVVANPNLRDLRARSGAIFSYLLAYRMVAVNALLAPGSSAHIWGYQVSGDYFEGLGIKPALGRLLSMDDDRRKGGHPVAVLAYSTWRKRFGGDPQIVGRSLKLNGFPFTIVGVTPPEFNGTERFYAPELFTSWAMIEQIEPGMWSYDRRRDSENTFVIARLRPGVDQARAQAGLDGLTAQLAREYPKENEGFRLNLGQPGWAGNFLHGPVMGFNAVLMALGGALLLVVCINLANLLLAQGSERRKETAVRLAIGAGRGQLIRQLLLESVLLAALGGGLGMLVAFWTLDAISAFRPPVDFAVQMLIKTDYRVAFFAAAVTLFTSLLFGLVPALQATKVDLASAIKSDASGSRQRQWPLRDVLVIAQIAMSVVLLVCSGLMLRSLSNAMSVSLGFEPIGAAELGLDLGTQGYKEDRAVPLQHELLRRLRSLPGVASAAIVSGLPLDFAKLWNATVYETGKPEPPASQRQMAQVYAVSPRCFQTMRTRLLDGREFDERDAVNRKPVLIVNRQFAREILKLDNPLQAIGKRVQTEGTTYEIIALTEDGKYLSLSEAPKPVMFFDLEQRYESSFQLVWRVRPGANLDDTMAAARRMALELDPELTIVHLQPLERSLNLPLLPARFAASVITSFGMVTMLLAALGIYGVTAFAVSRRTREIGIRLAIGAAPAQIAQLILKRASILIGAGAVAGALLAMLAAGLLTPILIGVNPQDLPLQATGAAVMIVVAAVACLVPARRAARLDPSSSLRSE